MYLDFKLLYETYLNFSSGSNFKNFLKVELKSYSDKVYTLPFIDVILILLLETFATKKLRKPKLGMTKCKFLAM